MEAQSTNVCPSRSTAPFIVVYAKIEGGRGRSNFANRVSGFLAVGYDLHGDTEYYECDGEFWGLQSLVNKEFIEERRSKYKTDQLETELEH